MKSILSKAQEGGFVPTKYMEDNYRYWNSHSPSFHKLIFSHDFLNAYAKYIIESEQENKIGGAFIFTKEMRESKYHFGAVFNRFATQLVLSTDRIKYLRGFLDE